jgi:hypothetical protein
MSSTKAKKRRGEQAFVKDMERALATARKNPETRDLVPYYEAWKKAAEERLAALGS